MCQRVPHVIMQKPLAKRYVWSLKKSVRTRSSTLEHLFMPNCSLAAMLGDIDGAASGGSHQAAGTSQPDIDGVKKEHEQTKTSVLAYVRGWIGAVACLHD